MLQSLTQVGAQILDPTIEVNPLNNYFFTAISSILIVALGWYLTDKVVEPRLAEYRKWMGIISDLPAMDSARAPHGA